MKFKHYRPHIISSFWGFAEATFFFIVPDVFLTYRALKSFKSAYICCLFALIGALIGGIIMYAWAEQSGQAQRFVEQVPAINSKMTEIANSDYANHGALALLIAPLRGVPYKLYTVIATQYNVGLIAFVAISIIARLGRFIITSAVVALLSRLLKPWLSYKQRLLLLIAGWTIFYVIYFFHNR